MEKKPPLKPFSWFFLLLGPVIGVLIYSLIVGHPLDVPDLEVVSDSRDAAQSLTGEMIWRAPFPWERPDLAAYRPAHALLLKLQYELWPGNIPAFRWVSLFLFGGLCAVYALFVCRLILSAWGRAGAILLLALHPMASEAVNVLAAQNVLLAALGWATALWIYRLALEEKLRTAIASPLLSLCFFISLGAHEASILLPLALIALDRTTQPPAVASTSRRMRLASYGLPMILVGLIRFGLRWGALRGSIIPGAAAQSLGEMGLGPRLLAGCSAALLAILKLLLPFNPSYFHPVRYEGAWPWWISIPLLLVMLGGAIRVTRGNSNARLGLALAGLPLLALFQWIPMTQFLPERWLLLSLPGLGLLAGAALDQLTRNWQPGWLGPKEKATIAASIGALALFGAVSIHQSLLWGQPARHWERETRRHPLAPQPLVHQLIHRITRSNDTSDSTAIDALARSALALAKPPDADPVYQYLTIRHLQRQDKPQLKKTIEDGLAAPGPHISGYYSALGVAALWMNEHDLAQTALEAELRASPRDFNALFASTELSMKRAEWQRALELAEASVRESPAHMAAPANLRLGVLAAKQQKAQQAMAAYTNSIAADPTLPDAYLALARLYIANQQYKDADLVLGEASRKARMASVADLIRAGTELLEKEKPQIKVNDFVREKAAFYPADIPLQFFAARYLFDHEDYSGARRIYSGLLSLSPGQPDVLTGLARIALVHDRNPAQAMQYLQMALSSNPNHAEAQTLFNQLSDALKASPQPPVQP